MTQWVVDTNVPIVANGRAAPGEQRAPSTACRLAAVQFLSHWLKHGTFLLDYDGAIQAEYRNHLRPDGQPGVGDRFYQVLLHSNPALVRRVVLPTRADGEYEDMPQALIDEGFDRSDRKFVALALREAAPVVNAVDSDWMNHALTLAFVGLVVHHVCGVDATMWFEDQHV